MKRSILGGIDCAAEFFPVWWWPPTLPPPLWSWPPTEPPLWSWPPTEPPLWSWPLTEPPVWVEPPTFPKKWFFYLHSVWYFILYLKSEAFGPKREAKSAKSLPTSCLENVYNTGLKFISHFLLSRFRLRSWNISWILFISTLVRHQVCFLRKLKLE